MVGHWRGVPSEILRRVTNRCTLFLSGFAIVLTTITGPFGTYGAMDFWGRLQFWGLVIVTSVVLGLAIRTLVTHRMREATPFLRDVVVLAGFTGTFVPALALLIALMADEAHDYTILHQTAVVVVIASGVMVTRRILGLDEGRTDPTRRCRLLVRIGAGPGLRVVRMSADDHYVEVILDDGSRHRVLIRFADAVAELDGAEGYCIHRSHWVADAEVLRAGREKQREFVELRDGTRLPVGKTYRNNLLARGFLAELSAAEGNGTATGLGPSRTAKAVAPRSGLSAGSSAESPPV